MKSNLLRKLTMDEITSQWGYYGILYNNKDDLFLVTPENLIVQTLNLNENPDYSKTFSLMIDWLFRFNEILRCDLLLQESKKIETENGVRLLCGLLHIVNCRKFNKTIEKIIKGNNPEKIIVIGSHGRIRSFGEDPILLKYGISTSLIQRTRDDKKIANASELIRNNHFLRNRFLMGSNSRADFFSLRSLLPNVSISTIRVIGHISKTSSVYFEKDRKILNANNYFLEDMNTIFNQN